MNPSLGRAIGLRALVAAAAAAALAASAAAPQEPAVACAAGSSSSSILDTVALQTSAHRADAHQPPAAAAAGAAREGSGARAQAELPAGVRPGDREAEDGEEQRRPRRRMNDIFEAALDIWKQKSDEDAVNGPPRRQALDRDPASTRDWSSMASASSFELTGSCQHQQRDIDGNWTRQGVTISGRSWFSNSLGRYLYWDPSCDGQGFASSWVIDSQAPRPARVKDLDGDGACVVDAWTYSEGDMPPFGQATWRMWCGDKTGWRNVQVRMIPAPDAAAS